jgi:hypothetical protein
MAPSRSATARRPLKSAGRRSRVIQDGGYPPPASASARQLTRIGWLPLSGHAFGDAGTRSNPLGLMACFLKLTPQCLVSFSAVSKARKHTVLVCAARSRFRHSTKTYRESRSSGGIRFRERYGLVSEWAVTREESQHPSEYCRGPKLQTTSSLWFVSHSSRVARRTEMQLYPHSRRSFF